MQVSKCLNAIQERVDCLEDKGWAVRLIHSPKTLRTTTMIAEHGKQARTHKLFMGQASCVDTDQFSRAVGTRIAFDRMVHAMTANLGRKAVKTIFQEKGE